MRVATLRLREVGAPRLVMPESRCSAASRISSRRGSVVFVGAAARIRMPRCKSVADFQSQAADSGIRTRARVTLRSLSVIALLVFG